MFIDIIAFVLLLMGIYKGLRKGLIIGLFSFLGFLIGLAAALKLSAIVAGYLGNNVNIAQRWLPVLAFTGVFILVILLVRLGAKMLEGLVELAMLGWLNKLGGILLYLLIYLFVFSILLFYCTQLHLIKNETTQASVSFGYIQPLGPKMINALGTIVPFFKHMFEQLLQFFQNISDKKTTANIEISLLVQERLFCFKTFIFSKN